MPTSSLSAPPPRPSEDPFNSRTVSLSLGFPSPLSVLRVLMWVLMQLGSWGHDPCLDVFVWVWNNIQELSSLFLQVDYVSGTPFMAFLYFFIPRRGWWGRDPREVRVWETQAVQEGPALLSVGPHHREENARHTWEAFCMYQTNEQIKHSIHRPQACPGFFALVSVLRRQWGSYRLHHCPSCRRGC